MPLGYLAAATVISAGVGAYESSQANSIASSSLGMSEQIFGEQQNFEKQLAALIQNPSSVTSLPGYQFQFQQGSDAVARQMAAAGYLGSGNEEVALTQFGQGLAQNFYTTQANLLASLSGITNASSPSQAGAVATGANANSSAQINNLLGQLGAIYGYTGGSFGSAGAGTTGTPGTIPGYNSIGPTMPAGGGYTYNTPGWGGGG